jgi:hypothetical protein
VTVQYALAEYGIASEIQAVGVGIAAAGTEPQLYGGDDGLRPHYNQDGTFNGHTILVIPAAGRLLDPDYPAVRGDPAYGAGRAAGNGPTACPGRARHSAVRYRPHRSLRALRPAARPVPQRLAKPGPRPASRRVSGSGREPGRQRVNTMRGEGLHDRIVRSPYPRLRALLTALDGTTTVADAHGYRFADPATGRELRLVDIP